MKDRFIYSLTCPKRDNCVALLYFNLDSKLIGIEFNHDATDEFKTILGQELSLIIDDIERFVKGGCQVKDISNIDLSFERFWDVYANKVGNIKRCQKLWKQLTKEEKILALGFIRRLRIWYNTRNIQFPYPETYLNQRRWENIID